MARLEGAYEQINHRLGTIESRLSGLESRLDRLDSKIDAVNNRVSNIMYGIFAAILVPIFIRVFFP